MTDEEIRKASLLIVQTLQEAVDEELERKAKLGQQAVICDKNGKPKVVSAKYLVRKRRAARQQLLK